MMVEQRSLHKMMKNKKRTRMRLRRKCPPTSVALEEKEVEPAVLQRLFLSCQDVFKGHGTVPSPEDVSKLCRILDGMMPEDVGLSPDLQFFKPQTPLQSTPVVTYTTIYQCDKFSLCIFFLPATAVIPLHNHPGMTVFSKLLVGTVHIKSYDWAYPTSSNYYASPSQPRLAKMKADKTFTAPCDTSVLYPTSGGNIHEFTARTPCAVLDVMGPPYSEDDGRDCSYYKETPYSRLPNGETTNTNGEGNDAYGWLEEIEMPQESQMDGIKYLGPPIIDTA